MAISNLNIVRVAAKMTVAGIADCLNVYHVVCQQGTSGGTDAAYRLAIQEYIAALYATIAAVTSNAVTSVVLELFNESTDNPEAPLAWTPAFAGGDAGQLLPSGVAGFVWLRTNVSRVQGRKYLPPSTETQNGVGAWVAGYQAAAAAFGAFLLVAFTASNGAVIQYGVFRPIPGSLAFPTSAGVASDARYQRRRRAGVGS